MRIKLSCIIAIMILDCALAHAQLFGRPRNLRQPIANRNETPTLAESEDVGTLSGSERFLRANRNRASFVGADQLELQNFIGRLQARTQGTIVSSTAGIQPAEDRSSQINRAMRPARRKQMYAPKVMLDADIMEEVQLMPSDWKASVITRNLQATIADKSPEVEVSVEGRTATLRGYATSARERKLVETLVSFEPGISTVKNLIQVIPQPPAPEYRQN